MAEHKEHPTSPPHFVTENFNQPLDRRVEHSDREILTEFDETTGYSTTHVDNAAADSSNRKQYGHSLWNPVEFGRSLDGLGRIIVGYIIVAALITLALVLDIRYGAPQVPPHAGAVTDVPKCSEIGMKIMKRGGSAVDAAIASMMCVEVINFQSTGIGGGGFMLVYDHKKREGKILDFREVAPARFKPEMLAAATTASTTSATNKTEILMTGVPGLLKGFDAAHKLYGRLPWHELFDPAVRLARTGFSVTSTLAHSLRDKLLNRFLNDQLRKLVYANNVSSKSSSDDFVTAGTMLKREDLAYTLERIANMGAEEFYEGNLAQKLVDDIQEMGGILTLNDLREYHIITREPLIANISDYVVVTSPAPASGAALIFGLKLMEKFADSGTLSSENLKPVPIDHRHNLNNADAWHFLIETLKYVFLQQSRLGDVSGISISTSDAVNKSQIDMLSPASIDRAFASINFSHVLADTDAYYDAVGLSHADKIIQPSDSGTSGGVFVDNDELYVSVITSLNYQFGAGVMSKHLGILLNNQLRDFSTDETNGRNNNLPRPYKRPLSSMTPTAFFHPLKSCYKRGVVAGSNGTRLLSGMFEVLTRLLIFNENATSAIEAPRVHVDDKNADRKVYVERGGMSDEIVHDLVERRGQNLEVLSYREQSAMHALMKWNDTLVGHGDSRKHGGDSVYR